MENEKIIMTTTMTGQKITIKLPWDASCEDLCNAFFATCVGLTFMPNIVVECMHDFSERMSETMCSKK